MSHLRKFAQANSAAYVSRSPHTQSPRATGGAQTPTRVDYASPASSPSLSASIPFDWEASRIRRVPPYGTPLTGKRKARVSHVDAGTSTPKRVVRKKGMVQRITDILSRIMFEISLFPHNVPLPAPKTSGWLMGISMHILHLGVRIARGRATSEADVGWEDLYWERSQQSWFDWTVLMTLFLFIATTVNAMHLFTQTRTYNLHLRSKANPVSSPHATFVQSPRRDASPPRDTRRAPARSTFARRIVGLVWSVVAVAWGALLGIMRFLLGLSTASPSTSAPPRGTPPEEVQQLEVWTPGELERTLLAVYSPAHALLWVCVDGTNWMVVCVVMGVVGVQMGALVRGYEGLVKDRQIVAAEVMHEYNEGFVYPTINRIRRDVAVMTHEAEIVDVWGD